MSVASLLDIPPAAVPTQEDENSEVVCEIV